MGVGPVDGVAVLAAQISRGSGTTPTLMGFGDDPDKFVVIADGAEGGTNLVAFWRDDIPEDFEQKSVHARNHLVSLRN